MRIVVVVMMHERTKTAVVRVGTLLLLHTRDTNVDEDSKHTT
jgi:hypothetical protein